MDDKLFVVQTTDNLIQAYIITEREGKVKLRPSTVTKVPFMADNIRLGPKSSPTDFKLYVTGHPKILEFIASCDGGMWAWLVKIGLVADKAWSQVVELSRHETDWYMGDRLQSKTLLLDNGSLLSGATSGMLAGDKLIASGILEPGILVCDHK